MTFIDAENHGAGKGWFLVAGSWQLSAVIALKGATRKARSRPAQLHTLAPTCAAQVRMAALAAVKLGLG